MDALHLDNVGGTISKTLGIVTVFEGLQGFLAHSFGVHVGLLITLSYKGVHFGAETHEFSDWVLTVSDLNTLISSFLSCLLLLSVAIVEVQFVNVTPQGIHLDLQHEGVCVCH